MNKDFSELQRTDKIGELSWEIIIMFTFHAFLGGFQYFRDGVDLTTTQSPRASWIVWQKRVSTPAILERNAISWEPKGTPPKK